MLESNLDIMSPQWTDVIFKDRNQAYGAYQLRKNNANNTSRALIIAISIFFSAFAVPTIINKMHGVVPVTNLPTTRIIEVNNIQPPIIMQQPKAKTAQPERQVQSPHDMIKSFPPVVKAEANEDPPTVKQLEIADPGPQTLKGVTGAALVIGEKPGTIEVKGTDEANTDVPFVTSEIPPLYPGGEKAFGKFLSDHIRYPAIAKENSVTGRVFLQFIVERDGSLTDMKILRDPGSGLGEEAARVLKISPHWSPGMQNGQKVRVQFTIPINFSLNE